MESPSENAVLFLAVGDPAVRAGVAAELRRRFGADYSVLAPQRADAAAALESAAASGAQVALVISDDHSPQLFARARGLFPDARRCLLIEWGSWADPVTEQAVLALMAANRIDYYLVRPRHSPDEYFHRTVTEFLVEWQRATGAHPSGLSGLRTALPTSTVDLAVVGAGPGGLAAAVYAASDPRTFVQRQHDVFTGLLTAGLRSTDTSPGSMRSTAQVTAVISLQDLKDGKGVGVVEGIEDLLSATAIRRLVEENSPRRLLRRPPRHPLPRRRTHPHRQRRPPLPLPPRHAPRIPLRHAHDPRHTPPPRTTLDRPRPEMDTPRQIPYRQAQHTPKSRIVIEFGPHEGGSQAGPGERAHRYRCPVRSDGPRNGDTAVMASRWARFVRGWLTAGLSVFVAAVSHVAGGGAAPGLLGVVLAMAFAGIVCVALAGKSLSRIRLGVSVAASQFAFHLLFGLGAGAATAAATRTAGTTTATTSHGSAHQHAIALDTASGSIAMAQHDDTSMWAAHAVAGLITVVLLRRGESAFWRLVELARTSWVAVLVSRFVSISSVPVDGMRVRSAVADLSGLRDLGVLLSGQSRRGPPPRVATSH